MRLQGNSRDYKDYRGVQGTSGDYNGLQRTTLGHRKLLWTK